MSNEFTKPLPFNFVLNYLLGLHQKEICIATYSNWFVKMNKGYDIIQYELTTQRVWFDER